MYIKALSAIFTVLCLLSVGKTQEMKSNVTAKQALFSEAAKYRLGFSQDLYKFDFPESSNLNSSGGTINVLDIGTDAGLYGTGVAQVLFKMKPCSTVQPHVHPRSTEISFVTKGNLTFGLTEENGGRTIVKNVLAGQTFVQPQGYIHYTQNLSDEEGEFIASFGNVDFGTVFLSRQFMFPAEVISSAYGISMEAAQMLEQSAAKQEPITSMCS